MFSCLGEGNSVVRNSLQEEMQETFQIVKKLIYAQILYPFDG